MPFKKGQSGNPGGRPKEKLFTDALRMEIKAAGGDHKRLRKIADALLQKAESGDIQAIREVADRLDGKAPQAIEHQDDGGGPIITRIELVAGEGEDGTATQAGGC